MKTPQKHVWLLIGLGLGLAVGPGFGCASASRSGFYHHVQPGENLYRIGLRYGVPSTVLVKANRIRDTRSVSVGTRLWIPRMAGATGGPTHVAQPVAATTARKPSRASEARRLARLDARRGASLSFAWPLRGKLTSAFGRRRGRPHEGLDLAAHTGTPIRAAEAGRVIHVGRLGDYGRAVIVRHAGDYRSVYAHASRTLVRKGQFVEKGQQIALVGSSGRSTGPHLHFEIRRRESPRDPLLYLP